MKERCPNSDILVLPESRIENQNLDSAIQARAGLVSDREACAKSEVS